MRTTTVFVRPEGPASAGESRREPAPRADSLALACPRCPEPRAFLDLFYPDPRDPGRSLAICPDCRRWYYRRHPLGLRPTLVEIPGTCPLSRRAARRRPNRPVLLEFRGRHVVA
jgi:hypothetical protein